MNGSQGETTSIRFVGGPLDGAVSPVLKPPYREILSVPVCELNMRGVVGESFDVERDKEILAQEPVKSAIYRIQRRGDELVYVFAKFVSMDDHKAQRF